MEGKYSATYSEQGHNLSLLLSFTTMFYQGQFTMNAILLHLQCLSLDA